MQHFGCNILVASYISLIRIRKHGIPNVIRQAWDQPSLFLGEQIFEVYLQVVLSLDKKAIIKSGTSGTWDSPANLFKSSVSHLVT